MEVLVEGLRPSVSSGLGAPRASPLGAACGPSLSSPLAPRSWGELEGLQLAPWRPPFFMALGPAWLGLTAHSPSKGTGWAPSPVR